MQQFKIFLEKYSREISFLLLVAYMLGLLMSRAVLSISMMGIVLMGFLWSVTIGNDRLTRPQYNWVLLFGLMFIFGILSYFFSSDTARWAEYMRIWLPFLLLPFSFFVLPSLHVRSFYVLLGIFVILILLGTYWSLAYYIQDPQSIIKSYTHAKVLPTPMKGDHIRFSLLVVLASCISVLLAMVSSKRQIWFRYEKQFFIYCALFLFIYLHILAVKSGLLAGWLSFSWLAFFYFLKRRYTLFLILLSVVLITPIASYFFIPTFQSKLSYVNYEFSENKETGRVEHLSDVNRLVSYKLAWESIRQHPFTGVGLGDIDDETVEMYHKNFPEVADDSIILPHNQWLCEGMALGFPGMILLTLIFLYPLTIRLYRHSFMGICLSIVSFVALMVEPVFMVQFGVATYLLINLIFFKYYTAWDNKDSRLVFGCESLD